MPQLCIQFEEGYKPKHVADDKLLIKLCPDLFIYSSINSMLKQTNMPCLKKADDLFNELKEWELYYKKY